MKKIIISIILLFFIYSSQIYSYPIPENNKAIFDIIRKKKVIGSHEINFLEDGEFLNIKTEINIDVKILFFPAYKFFHESSEIWKDGNFLQIDAYTDFEDEREYLIEGKILKDTFEGNGMDGKFKIQNKILPSNFWNIDVMYQKEIFDTQKGIIRKIDVQEKDQEIIEINERKIKCKKFILNASSNPKDKGPFPEYTLWYSEKDELMKFKFKNWKDGKTVEIIRR